MFIYISIYLPIYLYVHVEIKNDIEKNFTKCVKNEFLRTSLERHSVDGTVLEGRWDVSVKC